MVLRQVPGQPELPGPDRGEPHRRVPSAQRGQGTPSSSPPGGLTETGGRGS